MGVEWPRTLLITDTETDGLDATVDRIIEIGAVLFSVEDAAVISTWSQLISPPEGMQARNAASDSNRIRPSSLLYGVSIEEATIELQKLGSRAEAVVAHNAVFDHAFIGNRLDPLPWLCSMDDMEWPRPTNARSLVAIALAHDVGIVNAHRALSDCMTLAKLFERAHEIYPGWLPTMLTRAMRPRSMFQALVSYGNRDLAKQLKFRWDADHRRWIRRMAIEDTSLLPFPVRDVDAFDKKVHMLREKAGNWIQPLTEPAMWEFCECAGPFPAELIFAECTVCLTRGYRPLPIKGVA